MKTLLIMRHAKSSWDDPTLDDFDRPLNKRGLRAAPFMGQFMLKRSLRPDLVLSSPAERARHTAELAMQAAQLKCPFRLDQQIWDASVTSLVKVVSEIEESARIVMLVGHNPELEELLLYLTGVTERMPTAALACVALNIARWAETRERCGQLEWVVRPKELAKDKL